MNRARSVDGIEAAVEDPIRGVADERVAGATQHRLRRREAWSDRRHAARRDHPDVRDQGTDGQPCTLRSDHCAEDERVDQHCVRLALRDGRRRLVGEVERRPGHVAIARVSQHGQRVGEFPVPEHVVVTFEGRPVGRPYPRGELDSEGRDPVPERRVADDGDLVTGRGEASCDSQLWWDSPSSFPHGQQESVRSVMPSPPVFDRDRVGQRPEDASHEGAEDFLGGGD